jgi:hypothetical protein
MSCTDFTTWGHAELTDDGHLPVQAATTALLNHNHRRCVVRPVQLTSANEHGRGDFVTPGGLCSMKTMLDPLPASPAANSCTDFVLWGVAFSADRGGGYALDNMRRALTRGENESTERVQLTSHNVSSGAHFILPDGTCSTPLTNRDIVWFEGCAGVPPGTFFKALRQATEAAPSACEVAWEPMARYAALSRANRSPRGAKTAAHIEALRQSNPLISPSGWHDWSALVEQVKHSWAAQVHQQALIDRERTSAPHLSLLAPVLASPPALAHSVPLPLPCTPPPHRLVPPRAAHPPLRSPPDLLELRRPSCPTALLISPLLRPSRRDAHAQVALTVLPPATQAGGGAREQGRPPRAHVCRLGHLAAGRAGTR